MSVPTRKRGAKTGPLKALLPLALSFALVAQMGFGAAFAYAEDDPGSTASSDAGVAAAADGEAGFAVADDAGEATGVPATGEATGLGTAVAADVTAAADLAGIDAPDGTEDGDEEGGLHPLMLPTGLEIMAHTGWYTGHEADTSYTLANAEDLAGLAELVNNGTSDFKDKTLTLSNTVLGATLPPIGTPDHPFKGTFDGGNNNITNLTIVTTNKQNVGLFGFADASALIKNVRLQGGTLTVDEPSQTGSLIKDVGTIAGHLDGSIENCSSSMTLVISSQLKASERQEDENSKGIIRHIGGLVGYLAGNMEGCSRTAPINVSSSSNVLDKMRYIVGELGGLVGLQGDAKDLSVVPEIKDSSNSGNILLYITGEGGLDRFGQQLLSVSSNVGGIVGSTPGSVSRCTNSGIINTAGGNMSDAVDTPTIGRGASMTGGIVGGLRESDFDKRVNVEGMEVTEDAGYNAWKASAPTSGTPIAPLIAGIYDCKNTGTVIGLTAVGGIVGSTGSFVEIVGCGNTGDVKGCRWNKPFTAGIAGMSRGDIRYCYNRGSIYSVTGAGYYCCGIAGNFTSVNPNVTDDRFKVPMIEMTGCYTTGQIYTSSPGFRTGILAGESDGYIHANAYLPNLTPDNKLVELNSGTLIDNLEFSADELKGSVGIAKLNTQAAGPGQWEVFYLPDSANTNGGYPLPSRATPPSVPGATDINTIGATATKAGDASYTPSYDPSPTVSVTSGQGALTQNADFRVVPQEGAKAMSNGVDSYTATIEGMGRYTGMLGATVPYGIAQGDIGQCTIVAEEAIFNWERQEPLRVWLLDSAGNVVDPKEYTWITLANEDGSTALVDGLFYDYINAHSKDYKYPIRVTANATSNYIGTTTQNVFRIAWASLRYDIDEQPSDPPRPESVKLETVWWQGTEWDFITAMKDETGNTVQITYTGSEIKPTIKNVTYKNKVLRDGTGQAYWDAPFNYDYKYIYGNPNPEESGTDGSIPINVTPEGEPGCMTIRFTNGGNFDNYSNVFYQIVPADLSLVAAADIPTLFYSGSAVTPDPTLTYNEMTLVNGKDYALSYTNNNGGGTAQVTITGQGNYKGTKTLSFEIQSVTQHDGQDRFETAVKASTKAYPDPSQVDTVILAYAYDFPDALAASYLAGAANAPILLSDKSSLDEKTGAELGRLRPGTIYIVGGEGAIDSGVEATLRNLDFTPTVIRLGGADRSETAYKIAEAAWPLTGAAPTSVFVAHAHNFPDALSAGSLAASQNVPILLSETNALNSWAERFIREHAIKDVIIVGGTGSVSDAAKGSLEALPSGPAVARWWGADRYATAQDVLSNASAKWSLRPTVLGLASGEGFPDALVGGAAVGNRGGLLLITDPDSLSSAASNAISTYKADLTDVEILGGTGTIRVNDQVRTLLSSASPTTLME
jgi:putative cell wall-binding protein